MMHHSVSVIMELGVCEASKMNMFSTLILLFNRENLILSEIHKTLYVRFILKKMQRYYVTFKAPFHLFF